MATPRSLIELRVLDGPNRHFRNPAIQLRVDVHHLLTDPAEDMSGFAKEVDLELPAGPGEPGSAERREVVADWLRAVARHLASLDGVRRLAVRVGAGYDDDELMVAFPWSRERRATRLAEWIAWVADDAGRMPLAETFAEAATRLRSVAPGPRSTVIAPLVPTVGITGTNGKTTTTRLIGHLVMAAGKLTAWNSTDGIYAARPDLSGGDLVEAGDWAGFGGAGRVLATPGIEVAVVEVARGGILRRGMGVSSVTVGVVTNVTTDHMGEMGINTLDDLAEVKSTVVRAVEPDGWAVLNADDDRVRAMAGQCEGGVIGFSADPASAGLAALAALGARCVTVQDGWIVCLAEPADAAEDPADRPPLSGDSSPSPDGEPGAPGETIRIVPVAEVPMTIGGLSANNLANALAATAAGWALDLPPAAMAAGLRGFTADAGTNPGRLNLYRRADLLVIVDVAHNPDSLAALCGVARGLLADDGTLHLLTGTLGDRTPEIIREMGRLAVTLADVAVIAEKPRYLRGEDAAVVVDLLNDGAHGAGRPPMPVYPDEFDAFDATLDGAEDGDVIAFAVHDHLGDVVAQLASRGFTPATAEDIAARLTAS